MGEILHKFWILAVKYFDVFIMCLFLQFHSYLTCGCVLHCVADRHWFQSADANTSSPEGTNNKMWSEAASIYIAHQSQTKFKA
jgi:hypothetical protein